MKTTLYAKLMAASLSLLLALTACMGPSPNKNTSSTTPTPIETVTKPMTVGALADYFIQAADDYHPGADRVGVLEGFDEAEQATWLQMFVIASRAFGQLPAPTGNGKNTAPPPVDLTDAPEWAWSALRNLSNGGVLAASDLGLPELETAPETTDQDAPTSDGEGMPAPETDMTDNMESDPAKLADTKDASSGEDGNDKMNALVTRKDAEIVAQRFFQVFGTNLKDNFYAAVNKGELDVLELPSDGSTVGGSSTVVANTDKQLHDLILEIVHSGEDYPQGSARQKIRDLYQSVLALEERNAAGVEPLRKYLDAVDAAQNFSELNAAIALAVKELGNFGNGIFPMVAVTDTQDSSKKVM